MKGLDGIGVVSTPPGYTGMWIAGVPRPDHGDGMTQLVCDRCHAGWVGQPNEPCGWCQDALELMRQSQERRDGKRREDDNVEPASADGELRGLLLDWPTFWQVDRDEAEWLAEPIIPAKRSVAMFAPGGEGKSLLSLWLAAALATGRPIFGRTNPPRSVLYLDYEMTEDDLQERLDDMGYGPDDDLTRLHYALLPSLPGLDEPEGGKAVTRLAQLCDAELVVIDTFGRAVHGDENEADTVRAWYRWTGLHLKADGRAFVRIDHAGKDVEKGQRGTSAKNDDVDVVWRLTRQDGDAYKLVAKKRRMGWVPETVDLIQDSEDGLTYRMLGGGSWPAGTAECARDLDKCDVPLGASASKAIAALREAGRGSRRAVVLKALRYRRDEAEAGGSQLSGTTPRLRVVPEVSEPPHDEVTEPQVKGGSQHSGTTGNHPPCLVVPGSPPLKGEPVPDQPGTDEEELF
jgi:hypothetical protein